MGIVRCSQGAFISLAEEGEHFFVAYIKLLLWRRGFDRIPIRLFRELEES